MIKYRIGICDDNISVCSEIEESIYRYFKDKEDKVDVNVWSSGEALIPDLKRGEVLDILFLDIELSGIDGIDIGRCIRDDMDNCIMQIVYISAKTSYAMELFKVHPFDFLVKPLSEEKIHSVLQKMLHIRKCDMGFFKYMSHGNENAIQYRDIFYLNSNDKHIEIHLIDGNTKTYVGKLRDEESKLPNWFSRTSQSYIVNMKYIKSCTREEIILENGSLITISAKYRLTFRQSFSRFLGEQLL